MGVRWAPRRLAAGLVLVGAFAASGVGGASAATPGSFTTTPLPAGVEGLGGVASGWDGNVWFTARAKSTGAGLIGRVSGIDGPSPVVTTFPVGVGRAIQSQPSQIVMGRQYEMWFTDPGTDSIGRVTFGGTGSPIIELFDPPDYPGTPQPVPIFPRDHLWDLTVGADGNVWYATTRYFKPCPTCAVEDYPVIGKVSNLQTSTPNIEEFPAPDSGGQFTGITAGPDGRLWYSRMDDSLDTGRVGRVSNLTAATPTIQQFDVPSVPSGCFGSPGSSFHEQLHPGRMAPGPDGRLWYGSRSCQQGYLVRVATGASPTFTPLAAHPGDVSFCDGAPHGITAGADSAMWISRGMEPGFGCADSPGDQGTLIRKPTVGSAFSAYPTGAFTSVPLTSGAEGSLWGVGVADSSSPSDAVARFSTGLGPPQFVNPTQIIAVAQQSTQINVSGVPGRVTAVTAHLRGLNHSSPADLDVLLIAPDGSRSVILSDVSAGASGRAAHPISISNAPGTFHSLPATGPLVPGRYKPTNYSAGSADTFPGSVGRAIPTSLEAFTGADPNGTWKLRVVSDNPGPAYGGFTHGWGLSLRTDASPPIVSGLSIANKVFSVGPAPTALVSQRRRRRVPRGTRFRYSLSERATVEIEIQRARKGVRLRRARQRRLTCVSATGRNRRRLARQLAATRRIKRLTGSARRRALKRAARRRRCTLYRTVGTLRRLNQGPGAVTTRFSGRIGNRRLRPGRYRARVTAIDGALNRSQTRRVSFRVVRRRR